MNKLLWNDIKRNKALSLITVFFMAVSAMLLALTAALSASLLGAIDHLMNQAQVPDYMQMHMGELDESAISRFAESRTEVEDWQICRFLNLENSRLCLGNSSFAESTQDNGLCMQGERFDFLLDMGNQIPEVLPGEVYVPVCYRSQYALEEGDFFTIGEEKLMIAGFVRDAQMNSMMASSKRFLVNETDYNRIAAQGAEEYLIEFRLKEDADANAFGTAYAAKGLPSNGPVITRPLIRMMNALSDGMMILVIFLVSIAVLLISMLCIHFILSHRMEKDRKEVGMLKALGVGKKEIRGLYFSKYVMFSACGALAGLIAAAALKAPLEGQIQELYGTADTGIQMGVFSLSAVIFAEGVILLSIRHCLKKTDRLSALEALFSQQNQSVRLGRYVPIGAAVAVCTFLMLIPQNLRSTISSPEFVTYMGIGDGEIRMDVRQAEDIEQAVEQIAAALEQDEEVAQYSVLRTKAYPAILPQGESINLMVEAGKHSIFPVGISAGTLPEGEHDIALSALNAEELGLSVGDSLTLLVDDTETSYRVSGIYSDITNGGKTAKINNVQDDRSVIWSVIYVSLNDSSKKEQWMEQYRQMGADVTDIEHYVEETYGQTLKQIQMAARMALFLATLVIFVVVVLFMRLIVEKDRYSISLHKALGFTGRDIQRSYLAKGMLHAALGMTAGIFLGNLCGEEICGMLLKSFGAEGFRFVVEWERVLLLIPAISLVAAGFAVLAGIAEIQRIKASECCIGKE